MGMGPEEQKRGPDGGRVLWVRVLGGREAVLRVQVVREVEAGPGGGGFRGDDRS